MALSGLTYKGPWFSVSNTPTLVDGVGTIGDCYIVVNSDYRNFDPPYNAEYPIYNIYDRDLGSGITTWFANYYIYYDGTKWQMTTGSGGGTGNLPSGGTKDQKLIKNSNTDYDCVWVNNNYSTDSTLINTVIADIGFLKGQVVYGNSSISNTLTVLVADNSSEKYCTGIVGLACNDTPISSEGTIQTYGVFQGLDTGGASLGDSVWVGEHGNVLFGDINKPLPPKVVVYLGIVTKLATDGEIFLDIRQGLILDELNNVDVTSSINGSLLFKDSTGIWKGSTDMSWDASTKELTITGSIILNGRVII